MRTRPIVLRWILACSIGGLAACSADHSEQAAGEAAPLDEAATRSSSAQGATDAVQRLFRPDSAEKAYVDSALAAIQRKHAPLGTLLGGELRRFDANQTRRYLLTARVWDSVSAKPVVRFFVLQPGSPTSDPSPILAADEIDQFAVDSLADFDRNGHPDVGYCIWPGRRGTRGEWHALEFRAGRWYSVSVPERRAQGCEPQAEP